MTLNLTFLKDSTVDILDVDDESDYRSYQTGDVLQVSYVDAVSDTFVNVGLLNGIVLLDVPRTSVKID